MQIPNLWINGAAFPHSIGNIYKWLNTKWPLRQRFVWAWWYICVDVRYPLRKAEPLNPRPSSSVWGEYMCINTHVYVRYMALSKHLATFPARGPSLLSQAPIMSICCWSSHANILTTLYPRQSLINNLHGCQDQNTIMNEWKA